MANSAIASTTISDAAKGASGGIFGILGGAAAGYVSSSGVLGEIFGKPKPPPPPFWETPGFWEYAGVGIAVVVLLVLVARKRS